jgi:hypothetical protein
MSHGTDRPLIMRTPAEGTYAFRNVRPVQRERLRMLEDVGLTGVCG